MKVSVGLLSARRITGVLVFAAIVYGYCVLTIKALLKSEVIPPHVPSAGWDLMEKVLAFPAFYFGPDPLTGLIVNALIWGLVLTELLLLFWPRRHCNETSR